MLTITSPFARPNPAPPNADISAAVYAPLGHNFSVDWLMRSAQAGKESETTYAVLAWDVCVVPCIWLVS